MTMVTYGHRVVSNEDAYVKLVERTNSMTVKSGTPGGTPVDFFPSCQWSFLLQSWPVNSLMKISALSTSYTNMVSWS